MASSRLLGQNFCAPPMFRRCSIGSAAAQSQVNRWGSPGSRRVSGRSGERWLGAVGICRTGQRMVQH
jgi:hypothetical protein